MMRELLSELAAQNAATCLWFPDDALCVPWQLTHMTPLHALKVLDKADQLELEALAMEDALLSPDDEQDFEENCAYFIPFIQANRD